MVINDISKSNVDEMEVTKVGKKSEFLLEVYMFNGQIKLYKYDNEEIMQEDIKRINHAKNLIMYG